MHGISDVIRQLVKGGFLGTDQLAVVQELNTLAMAMTKEQHLLHLAGKTLQATNHEQSAHATSAPSWAANAGSLRCAQDRMHLDCVFSILGDDVCLMLEEMMGEDSPTRRLVDEYSRSEPGKPYELTRQGVEFSAYMRENGYHIIPVAGADQLVRLPWELLVAVLGHVAYSLSRRHAGNITQCFIMESRALEGCWARLCILVHPDECCIMACSTASGPQHALLSCPMLRKEYIRHMIAGLVMCAASRLQSTKSAMLRVFTRVHCANSLPSTERAVAAGLYTDTALRTVVWLQGDYLGMSLFMNVHTLTPRHTCAHAIESLRCTACSQLYGCNVLNLGNSRIISVHAHTARQIVRDSHFRGDVQIIDFTPITSMYGAVHCSSQARPSCYSRV